MAEDNAAVIPSSAALVFNERLLRALNLTFDWIGDQEDRRYLWLPYAT